MQEISIYMRQIINDFDSLGDDGKLICILDKGYQHISIEIYIL